MGAPDLLFCDGFVKVSRRGTPPDALLAARINLIGVKESRQQGDGHDQHASFWDNIANTGSYQESLLMPEFHLSGRNEDGTQTKAQMSAPGGYTVGAIALAPTQYEIARAKAQAEAEAKAEAEKAAELARLRGEPTIAPTITPTIGKTRTDSDKAPPPASEVQATVATVREKAKTIVPDPVWTCTGVIEKHCAWVTPPDLTLRTRAESLAKTPGLEWLADIAKRDDVDWQKVELAAQNWDYKHAGLTKEGAAVVVIVVTILTAGWASSAGSAAGGAATSATGNAAVGAAVGAGVTAGVTALAAQTAVALLNNHGNLEKTLKELGEEENVKQVVMSMLTAGALQAVGGTSWMQNFKGTGITDRLVTNMVNATVTATVQTAVIGGSYEQNLKTALATGGINALAGWASGKIGDWYADANTDMAGKYLAHKVAHALVGCASAAAKNTDCASGAIGAAVGEAFAEMMGGSIDGPISDEKRKQILDLSKLVATATAAMAGYDVTAAGEAAVNSVANNFLMHSEALRLAKLRAQKASCTDATVCAQLDAQIKQIQAIDAKRDAEIQSACADPASAACKSWNALLQVAKDSYTGKYTYDPTGTIAEEQRDAAKLAFLYKQRVDHPTGYDLGGKALVGLAAAAVGVLGFQAASACLLNSYNCIATLNALADGLLADGAAGAGAYAGSKAAAQALKNAVIEVRAEQSMGKLLDDLAGQTISSPSLSKTAQNMANDGKLGEQVGLQGLYEETGRTFRPLVNTSNNGADGVAIVVNADGSKTIYVAEVKSSINGVEQAASAEGNPANKLRDWATLASKGEGSWKNLSPADKAFADEILKAIDDGVPVKGVQVQVGIPKSNTSGTPQVVINEWK